MLSERITTLFNLLNCNNSDIATYAGCSKSYIRLIHSNKRNYSPKDKPILLLANGIFSYADNENLIFTLKELCNVSSNSREILIPAIIAWLFNTNEVILPDFNTTKSLKRKLKSRSFGEKLDLLLNILELSNARLARIIKVDDSYISRFRSGVRSPVPNSKIANLLATSLYKRAIEQNLKSELSRLSGIPTIIFDDYDNGFNYFSSWLYEQNDRNDERQVDGLLECIDNFSYQNNITPLDISSFAFNYILHSDKNLYYGIDGMREAVIRFLGNPEKQNGELWLYSDEELNWLVEDKIFYTKWYSLMLACVKRGIKIKIIHNINRGTDEMISAIQSCMPLYMSGMIEPYVCHRGRNSLFSHTIFLSPGSESIYAFHVRGIEKNSCYEYITTKERLLSISLGFDVLFSQSLPLIRIHINDGSNLFYSSEKCGKSYAMLSSLSLGTLPESLLLSMLNTRNIDNNYQTRILEFCKIQRDIFENTLQGGKFYELLSLPKDADVINGNVKLNLASSLYNNDIYYTSEEFTEHIRSIINIFDTNSSYNFFAIPELPFNDIQIILNEKKAIVIKSNIPYAAFVFTEPRIIIAFENYIKMLINQYQCDRSMIKHMLNRYI